MTEPTTFTLAISDNTTTKQLNKFILYNKSKYAIPLYAIGYAIQILLCIIGNCLELYILPRIKQTDDYITYAFCTLACSDLIQGFLTMPASFMQSIIYDWFLGETACKLTLFIAYVNTVIGIWIMVYIAFDRYINICFPMRLHFFKRKSFCLNFLSLLCLGNTMFFFYIFYYSELQIDPKLNCKICNLNLRETKLMVHRIAVHIFYLYTLPMVLLIFLYGSLFKTISEYTTLTVFLGSKIRDSKRKSQLCNLLIEKVSLFLVIIFILTHFPLFLHKLFDIYFHRRNRQYLPTGYKILKLVARFTHTMTSCINPWIYSLYSKKYRKELIQIFYFRGNSSANSWQTTASFLTRSDHHMDGSLEDELD